MPIPREVPFEAWKAKDAADAIKTVPEFGVNKAFMAGDHWQSAVGWMGPRPALGESGAAQALTEISNGFTSRNVVAEVVERHTSGVVGNEPIWSLVPRRALEDGEEPTPEEQAAIDEAEALLTAWWDRRGVATQLQNLTAFMLWAQRGVIRLFVPPGLLAEDGKVVSTDEADALDHVHIGTPSPDNATVYIDPDTQESAGVFTSEVDSKKITELVFRAGRASEGFVDGGVVVRMIGQEGEPRYVLQLGGRLTMYQVSRPLMVTAQVQQLQKALNLALSMLPRNVVTGGFLERVLLNAQMPGHYEDNPNGGSPIFVADAARVGAGTTNYVLGVTDTDDTTGSEKTLNPDIRWRPPVEVKPAIEAKAALYGEILGECDQAHVLMDSDAGASGISRQVARASYVASLTRSRAEIEGATRWLLETLLALVEAFRNQPGRWTSLLRAVAYCQLDEGPLSPEERAQNVAEAEKGLLANATAMARNGVTDPDAELAQIAGQENSVLALRKQQAEVMQILTRAGAGLREAALAVGMDEETANLLAGSVIPPDEPDTDPVEPPTDEPNDDPEAE